MMNSKLLSWENILLKLKTQNVQFRADSSLKRLFIKVDFGPHIILGIEGISV